jgi:hypothetical protein
MVETLVARPAQRSKSAPGQPAWLPGSGCGGGVVITFDAVHATDFFDQVFGDVSSGRIGISYTTSANRMHSEHFQWGRAAVVRAAEWEAGRPQGIYFRCCALPPDGVEGDGRGGADDSHALAFLWADLDYGTVGHAEPGRDALPLPTSAEDAIKIIDGMPEPTLVIHSGGGLYPIWQLDRPVMITRANRAEVKVLSANWQKVIKAKAEGLGWHYSPVGDLARVLRLPGSVNRKAGQERPCRVIGQTGVVHPWADLSDVAERLPSPKVTPEASASLPRRQATPRLLAGLLRAVATAQVGNRNNMLHWAGCCAVAQGLGGNLAVHDALADAARSVGLGEREIAATLRSAGFRS